jgi:hypothetical protein
MFIVGMTVWVVGVLLYCNYAYIYYAPWDTMPRDFDRDTWSLLATLYATVILGFIIVFVSIGLAVFKGVKFLPREKLPRRLGLGFVVIGLILRLVHYVLYSGPFHDWRLGDSDWIIILSSIPTSILVSNVGMLLIGIGLGLLVFGAYAFEDKTLDTGNSNESLDEQDEGSDTELAPIS